MASTAPHLSGDALKKFADAVSRKLLEINKEILFETEDSAFFENPNSSISLIKSKVDIVERIKRCETITKDDLSNIISEAFVEEIQSAYWKKNIDWENLRKLLSNGTTKLIGTEAINTALKALISPVIGEYIEMLGGVFDEHLAKAPAMSANFEALGLPADLLNRLGNGDTQAGTAAIQRIIKNVSSLLQNKMNAHNKKASPELTDCFNRLVACHVAAIITPTDESPHNIETHRATIAAQLTSEGFDTSDGNMRFFNWIAQRTSEALAPQRHR